MKNFKLQLSIAIPALLLAGASLAADGPSTADVLGKLHHSNQKEIQIGKLAEKNGQSKGVKSYGKTLVKDHTAADKKVTALAKKEKIDLETNMPPMKDDDMSAMGMGADFDKKFADAMLEDHKKDVTEASDARDKTTDRKLKKLLADLVPTLQKHQDIAQKLVDGGDKK